MRLSATAIHAVSSESNTVSAARTVGDTTAPTLTITTSDATLDEGETATITFTWSETVTGFADGDITTTGGTLASISGSGATYTATFTPTADSTTDGVITVGAGVVTDAAGNANSAGDALTMTVDTTPAGTAELTFRYHMYGANMQDIYLFWETSSAATQLWTESGQQHGSSTTSWSLATVNMNSYVGQTGKFVLVALVGASSSYAGDAAFCDFEVERSAGDDIAILDAASQWKVHAKADASTSSSASSALSISTTVSMADNTNTQGQWGTDYEATPSSNTGPDKHHSNAAYDRYVYWEQSGANISGSRGYIARTTNEYTI